MVGTRLCNSVQKGTSVEHIASIVQRYLFLCFDTLILISASIWIGYIATRLGGETKRNFTICLTFVFRTSAVRGSGSTVEAYLASLPVKYKVARFFFPEVYKI